MNRNKIYFGVLLLILLAITTWASYGVLNTGMTKEIHRVSVIVNDSGNDRWTALHQGLEQAASDYDIDLNYVSTVEFASAEEELAVVWRELDNGAEGVIVQMNSSTGMEEELAQIANRAAVMLLETDVFPEDVYAIGGPDNTALGTALAEEIKEDFGDTLSAKKVGILCGNQEQIAMQERLQGVCEGIDETGAQVVWMFDSTDEANVDTILREETADIVVALANSETERMVDCMKEESESALYGVGCSEKAVYYLDKGVIRTLVVPNEFNMGYQSMEAIANQLRYRLTKSENCQVDYLVVDRMNLYDEDNQKILFPIVQ